MLVSVGIAAHVGVALLIRLGLMLYVFVSGGVEMLVSVGIAAHVGVALLIRLGLMLYGLWQDETMKVAYTGIDYHPLCFRGC